jgi:hypothetical protein
VKLELTAEIGHARHAVFAAYRDNMRDLAADLPNLRRLEEVSRTDTDGKTVVVNRCWGGADIPAVARPFVPEHLLRWDEQGTWDTETWSVDWEIVVPAFREAVRGFGTNRFEATDAGSTRLVVDGRLDVDVARVRGVPKLVARSARPKVERFIVDQVKPNVVATAAAVDRYLAAR